MNLIPSTNFKVSKVNLKMPFVDGKTKGHLVISGFVILDISTGNYVSIGSESPIDKSPVPTVYKKESTSLDAISGGLYEGYNLIDKNLLVK